MDSIKSDAAVDGQPQRATAENIHEFITSTLVAARAELDSAQSVARALTGASLRGVDSHGLRLLVHYAKVVQTGRVNPRPRLSFAATGPATGTVDADNGFGHHASYFAVDCAAALARESGIAAVSVINSSHFGAAGAYALHAVDQGLVALSMCNSDSFVLAHDGVAPFHGTNPLAFAAPINDSQPYLLEMATSVFPWNRVQDLMAKGLRLPADVAVDSSGEPTVDPAKSASLLPLGGIRFGYKGAGLAGMIEVLCAILSGMPHGSRIPSMPGPDLSSHRKLSHFFVVIDPTRFVSRELYELGIRAYLTDLRTQPAKPGARAMAPGDREWAAQAERQQSGIPVSDPLRQQLNELADSLAIARLSYIE